MPPPMLIPAESVPSSPIHDIINLTTDHTEEIKSQIHSVPTKRKAYQRSLTQYPRSSPPVPILSQKLTSSRTQTIIDLTDDDDNDFI